MSGSWMSKAAWYELLAACYLNPRGEIAEALVSGDLSDAFREIGAALRLDEREVGGLASLLAPYEGVDSEVAFHEIRGEHTRLFIGAGDPLVTPYAGVWDAQRRGKRPLLIVGRESMAIERFMLECGVSRPEGTGGPVDHIGTLLEFLSVLCLRCADAEALGAGGEWRSSEYAVFYRRHFIGFARAVAANLGELTTSDFFRFASGALLLLPDEAL